MISTCSQKLIIYQDFVNLRSDTPDLGCLQGEFEVY